MELDEFPCVVSITTPESNTANGFMVNLNHAISEESKFDNPTYLVRRCVVETEEIPTITAGWLVCPFPYKEVH